MKTWEFYLRWVGKLVTKFDLIYLILEEEELFLSELIELKRLCTGYLKWLRNEFQGGNNTGCIRDMLTESLTRMLFATLASSSYDDRLGREAYLT